MIFIERTRPGAEFTNAGFYLLASFEVSLGFVKCRTAADEYSLGVVS